IVSEQLKYNLKSLLLNTPMQKRSVTRLVKPRNFIHPDDTVILEDESERVQLGV
ncbi:unnamed protein product, partial [Brassica oleracea]